MKKIIILYDYFDPAFKAGGIIKSLYGLVQGLKETYRFVIITSAYDLKEKLPLNCIEMDRWRRKETYIIQYLSKKFFTYFILLKFIYKKKEESFYLNGIFSFKFLIFPIFIFQLIGKKEGLILSPRGMLQTGALGIKSRKKRIYIYFLKKLPLIKKIQWHATSLQERDDIINVFGHKINPDNIIVAENISLTTDSEYKAPYKSKNKVKFITVSLIVEMKNHIQFLKLLLQSDKKWDIEYSIYGPIKDKAYWDECLEIIKLLPKNIEVKYKGFLHPKHLLKAYEDNHFFVLPTKGENFGHAILESLTFGRPVIVSDKTPWQDLNQRESGWIFKNDAELYEILKTCVELDNDTYVKMSKAAALHSKKFIADFNPIQAYTKLFN